MVTKTSCLRIFLMTIGFYGTFLGGSSYTLATVCESGNCQLDVCSVRSSEAPPVRGGTRCQPGVCPLSEEDKKALKTPPETDEEINDEFSASPQPLQLLESTNTVKNPGPGFDMTYIGPPGGTPNMTTVNGPWAQGF